MTPRRILYAFFFLPFLGMGSVHGQDSPFQSRDSSSSINETAALTLPSGTPLQIALDKEVRVRKVGQVIHGRVIQPVYAFDHLVIPVSLGYLTPKEFATSMRAAESGSALLAAPSSAANPQAQTVV